MHMASAVIPRADPSPTQTPTFSQSASTSFFTFLIALMLLVCASGVLVLRAVIRRHRRRRRILEAINAGVISNIPSLQRKPDLYEVFVRAAGNAMDWQTLMPICAINLEKSQDIQVDSKTKPNRTVRGRLRELSGRRPTPPVNDAKDDEPSNLQVAVLIAMPSEHFNIPPVHPTSYQVLRDGKHPDSSIEVNDGAIPDLIFGISTCAVISDEVD